MKKWSFWVEFMERKLCFSDFFCSIFRNNFLRTLCEIVLGWCCQNCFLRVQVDILKAKSFLVKKNWYMFSNSGQKVFSFVLKSNFCVLRRECLAKIFSDENLWFLKLLRTLSKIFAAAVLKTLTYLSKGTLCTIFLLTSSGNFWLLWSKLFFTKSSFDEFLGKTFWLMLPKLTSTCLNEIFRRFFLKKL